MARLDGMPLAIELAAARAEALGVAGLLDRIEDRFALLTSADRLAPDRQRSLAAAVAWSYQLLEEDEQRVFRLVSVFPGPFTLEAAEAVAGAAGAEAAVVRLVECSLVSPPRPGADGRSRYVMLETLRAYGAGLLAQEGEDAVAAAALAGYTLGVAEEAAAGLQTSTGEVAAARRLDAEDATMRQVLAWAMDRDASVAVRLAVALAPWWLQRGRAQDGYPLLYAAAGRAEPGSDGWCAAQYWLGAIASDRSDLAGALSHYTAVRDAIGDRGPSRVLAACLAGRSDVLADMGRLPDAPADARRSLTVAREIGDPVGEAVALIGLGIVAWYAEDVEGSVQRYRQARQVSADIPGYMARTCSMGLTDALRAAGDLGAAARVCTGGLARSRETGDQGTLPSLLVLMAVLDVQAGRVEDAAQLQEAAQIIARTGSRHGLVNVLHGCARLCAATGRRADAVTARAAQLALARGAGSLPDSAWSAHLREAIREAQRGLGDVRGRAAEQRGAAMSLDTAAEYAPLLTAPAVPPSAAAGPGLARLSARERELVTLVAQGRTNTQIAAPT